MGKRSRYGSKSNSSSSSSSSSSSRSKSRSRIEKSKRKSHVQNDKVLEKEVKKVKKQKIALHFGYTSSKNPFGDPNIHEQFQWRKKLEKEGKPKKMSDEEENKKLEESKKEIERVRLRRKEREMEQEEMERLRAEESRLREAALYGDWKKREEDFHLLQHKVRSKIRLVEGREKPVDILAKNILLLTSDDDSKAIIKYKGKMKDIETSQLEPELRDPSVVFHGLSLRELEELQEDIRVYQELEMNSSGQFREYWNSLGIICLDELSKHKTEKRQVGGDRTGVHRAIYEDVEQMFNGKSSLELLKVMDDIQDKINNVTNKSIDIEYWESVLQFVIVFRARAKVTEIHKEVLQQYLQLLEQRQAEIRQKQLEDPEYFEKMRKEKEVGGEFNATDENNQNILLKQDDSIIAAAMYDAEEKKGYDKMEERVGIRDEVALPHQVYWWEDKYRPRKPRYFNRVRTGYDWNKYNQAHYDHDNPPPKTVQGYKFNVFYPDLIDKSTTPKFFLEPAESGEFCIIRFHAGPPYEDIAFKIVNREWETGRKRGYRCVFERGILQLHFNFKRQRYRR